MKANSAPPLAGSFLKLALLLAVTPSTALGADSGQPVECDSARPYRGARLHAAPPSRVFEEAAKPFGEGFDAATIGRLDAAMKKAMDATKAPAMTVAVGVPGRGLWSATRLRDEAGGAAPPRWFWFASVGKAFTAAVVLQLVEEGKLSLDDQLARWFPDYPNAGAITLDHLLTHTSGIYSFQADETLRAKPGYHPPEDLIKVARSHGNTFCPGEYWSYCNTGYVMLGRIVEIIEGQPFHESVNSRVMGRLELKNTKALAPREQPGGLARPHPADPREAAREPSLSTPYAAGSVVATAEDMVRFWHAHLGGRLLRPAAVRAQFERLYPMFGGGTYYGRGVMLYDVPDQDGRRLTWLGHSGGAPGTKALVIYSVEAGAFVAVALNYDGSAEATANLLLKALADG